MMHAWGMVDLVRSSFAGQLEGGSNSNLSFFNKMPVVFLIGKEDL
jgi:hypothetical protein